MATNIPVNGTPPGGSGAVDSINGRVGIVTLGKSDVGLSNVDNTSDTSKPVSTATQTALDGKVDKEVGKALSENDFTSAYKTKLDGIATGATANATDAQLRDRATHTGEQAISTVTGLQTALDAKIDKVVSVDNTLTRFDGIAGAVQGSGIVVDDTDNITGVASLQFTGGTGTEGRLSWNDGDGTADLVLKNGQSTLQLGQEQIVRVKNNTGTALSDGQVVYVTGAQGQRPTVALADADTEASSLSTIGVVTEPIADGAEGFATLAGLVRNLDTSAWTEGAQLYLSSTAGGLTSTRPASPAHAVRVGWVVRQHATAGSILVHVQNGYELDELHDVLITDLADGEILTHDAATGLWKNGPVVLTAPNGSKWKLTVTNDGTLQTTAV